MPKIFLNHKTEERSLVKKVQKYLNSCMLQMWLDEEQIRPGENLLHNIHEGLDDTGYFIAFISERYLDSAWCMRELDVAELNSNIKIIPVLIGDEVKVLKKANSRIKNFLKVKNYIVLNEYDIPYTAKKIADSIQADSKVWFDPVRKIKINKEELLYVEIHTVKDIPTDFFKHWDFDIEYFIKEEPLKGDLPIAFFGRAPAWLYTHLSIPLFNKRDVYIYNASSKGFVCTYATRSSERLGDFLSFIKEEE